ncbi:hypothetical protein TYRP_016049 [Tyrophagus putrescentiae]|nr:hypothetical protein TYRP_016049 [Tyrophagus putrescentiae]
MFQQLKERFFSSSSSSNRRKSVDDPNAPLTQREIDYIRLTWSYLRTDIANFKVFGADLFISVSSNPSKMCPFTSPTCPRVSCAFPRNFSPTAPFVMYTLGMLVDHLEEAATLEVMLKRLARNHYRRRINLTAFALLREAFLAQLLDRLGPDVVGPRELTAWRKAWALILTALEREFAALEVDVAKRGSYHQLSAAHRSARNSMLRSYVTAAAAAGNSHSPSVAQSGRGGLPPRSPTAAAVVGRTSTSVTTSGGNINSTTTESTFSVKSKRSLKLLMFKPFKLVRKSLQTQSNAK